MIRLHFSADPSFISRGIRFLTRFEFGHVGFLTELGTIIDSHIIYGNGVQERPYNYGNWSRVMVCDILGPKGVHERIERTARAWVGAPYDWTWILAFGLQRDWEEPDSWGCSELVAECCYRAGLPLHNYRTVSVKRITPRDICLSPFVRKRYEGPPLVGGEL